MNKTENNNLLAAMFFMSLAGILTFGGLYVVSQPVRPQSIGQVAGAATDNSIRLIEEAAEKIPTVLTFDARDFNSTEGGEIIQQDGLELVRLQPGDKVTYTFITKLDADINSTIYFLSPGTDFKIKAMINGYTETFTYDGSPTDKVYEGVSELSQFFRIPTQSEYELELELVSNSPLDLFGVSLGEIGEDVELLR